MIRNHLNKTHLYEEDLRKEISNLKNMLEIQKEKEESSYNEIAYLEPLTKQYDDSVYNINHTDGLLNRIRRSDSLLTED